MKKVLRSEFLGTPGVAPAPNTIIIMRGIKVSQNFAPPRTLRTLGGHLYTFRAKKWSIEALLFVVFFGFRALLGPPSTGPQMPGYGSQEAKKPRNTQETGVI